jgi:hypothetical protein
MVERRRRFFLALFAALVIAGTSLVAALQNHVSNKAAPIAVKSASTSQDSAITKLETLAIKGRAPKTGYSREQFGAGWGDAGRCDVRNYILGRDMTGVVTKSPTDCTVVSGTLNDPYTGKTIHFIRGAGTSTAVQIDHVVALSDAWQKGAQALDVSIRTQLYNDPLNLLAVDGPTNDKKGDSDAATWLPPNKTYRCAYVARQIAVKIKYTLWVTQAEHDAIKNVLSSCPAQTLPAVN